MTALRRLLAHFTGYSLAWMVVLLVFAAMSWRILSMDWRRNLMDRLESEAMAMDSYLSSTLSFRDIAGLNRLCQSLDVPKRRGERITFFNADGRIIADSKPRTGIPGQGTPSFFKPEVVSALKKGVGRAVRFSRESGRTMAFVAYPHVHLGKVTGVIRLGAPVSWRDNLLLPVYLKIAAGGVLLALCVTVIQGAFWRKPRPLKGFNPKPE